MSGLLTKFVGKYLSRKFLSPAISTALVVWAVKSMTTAHVPFDTQKWVIAGVFAIGVVYTVVEGALDYANGGGGSVPA